MEFYRSEPTAQSSWRLAVLMGANSRTYKFALGSALLQLTMRAPGRPEAKTTEQRRSFLRDVVRLCSEGHAGTAWAITA